MHSIDLEFPRKHIGNFFEATNSQVRVFQLGLQQQVPVGRTAGLLIAN